MPRPPSGQGDAPRERIPARPRDAATVVILREAGAGLEALMMRRHETMAFAGGEWVFPGGAVEPADASLRARGCTPVPEAPAGDVASDAGHAAAGGRGDLGPAVAACRETFEEAGILLARHRDGAPCGASEAAVLRAEHGTANAEAFLELLERNNLVLALDALVVWSRWVTPSALPRRFDTWFFVTVMPPSQAVTGDLGEAQEARWVRLESGRLPPLVPPITSVPTGFTLREVEEVRARAGSLAGMMALARSQCLAPIMLKIIGTAAGMAALLPWDAGYGAADGEGVPCDDRLRARFAKYPTRIEFDPSTRKPRES